jgi:hypothetical protein
MTPHGSKHRVFDRKVSRRRAMRAMRAMLRPGRGDHFIPKPRYPMPSKENGYACQYCGERGGHSN